MKKSLLIEVSLWLWREGPYGTCDTLTRLCCNRCIEDKVLWCRSGLFLRLGNCLRRKSVRSLQRKGMTSCVRTHVGVLLEMVLTELFVFLISMSFPFLQYFCHDGIFHHVRYFLIYWNHHHHFAQTSCWYFHLWQMWNENNHIRFLSGSQVRFLINRNCSSFRFHGTSHFRSSNLVFYYRYFQI